MSGGELAVVLASVAVVVVVAVLGAIGVSLSRAVRDLRRLLAEIRRDLLPAVQRIEEASGQVTGEVQRVGGLLDVAERVSERAENLSRVTYRALLEPLSAVVSLFRRGVSTDSPARPSAEPVAADRGGEAVTDASRPPRRMSWSRRLTMYLLRSGYRSASARVAAGLAGAQAQRTAATATRPPRRGAAGAAAKTNSAGSGASRAGAPRTGGGGSAGLPLPRQLLEAVREVTDEISSAMTGGRQALRADRKTGGRPE